MTSPRNTKSKGGSRYYKVEGIEVPSVTSVLDYLPKPFLPRWAAKVAAEYAVENADEWHHAGMANDPDKFFYRDKAIKEIKGAPFAQRDTKAELGSMIHEAMEMLLKGKHEQLILDGMAENEQGWFMGVVEFLDAVRPEVEHIETTVFHRSFGYAGTADIIGKVDGKRTVIDLKTSKDVYTSHGAQVAAYAVAPEVVENDRLSAWLGAEQGMVVCVDEHGGFKAVLFEDLEPWWELFVAAYAIWEKRDLKVPRALEIK